MKREEETKGPKVEEDGARGEISRMRTIETEEEEGGEGMREITRRKSGGTRRGEEIAEGEEERERQ